MRTLQNYALRVKYELKGANKVAIPEVNGQSAIVASSTPHQVHGMAQRYPIADTSSGL